MGISSDLTCHDISVSGVSAHERCEFNQIVKYPEMIHYNVVKFQSASCDDVTSDP